MDKISHHRQKAKFCIQLFNYQDFPYQKFCESLVAVTFFRVIFCQYAIRMPLIPPKFPILSLPYLKHRFKQFLTVAHLFFDSKKCHISKIGFCTFQNYFVTNTMIQIGTIIAANKCKICQHSCLSK